MEVTTQARLAGSRVISLALNAKAPGSCPERAARLMPQTRDAGCMTLDGAVVTCNKTDCPLRNSCVFPGGFTLGAN